MNNYICNVSNNQRCSTHNSINADTTTTTMGAITNQKKPQLIDNETKIFLEYIIQIGTFYTVAIFGIIVNIINIIVYKKQGLKDSITLGLFALSVSDLFVSGLPIETATCYALKFIFPDSNVRFISVHYVVSSWCRRMFYSFSCMITAMLSLERCLCIVLPFHVKIIFTKTRTAAIIVTLATIHVLSFVPIYATHQLRWKDSSPSQNASRYLSLWFAPHRDIIEDFNYTFMSIITPTLAQVIVTCCVVIMIHGLRQASRFRHAMTSVATTTTTTNESKSKNDVTDDASQGDANHTNNIKNTLSTKDARLVRTMVFLVALLSACNIPYLTMITAILAIPDFEIYKTYHNTYSLVFSITFVLSSLNASLNFFIYYNTSSKYKEIFHEVFSFHFKQGKGQQNVNFSCQRS